jgi:hypothetical protein
VTFASSPRTVRSWQAISFAGLVLIALLLAHDAAFVVRYGVGPRMDEAMSAGGHDAWWTPFMVAVLAVATMLAVASACRLGRLSAIRASIDAARSAPVDGPRYPAQMAAMWRRLLPTVAIALLVQENAEHFATEGHLAGLDPLAGAFTLPVIALVTLVVAAVGALVRWRIAVLEGHIAAARAAAWPRPQPFATPARARITAALLAHRWLLARQDPGRAPPAAHRP